MGHRNKKVMLTHTIYGSETVEIDVTDNTTDITLFETERAAHECNLILVDPTGEKYSNQLSRWDKIELYYDDTKRYEGYIDSYNYEHSSEGNYYEIVSYSPDIKIGWSDTGNRVFLNYYGHEILKGKPGDCTFSAVPASLGALSFVSDSASDTQKLTLIGKSGVFVLNERVTLNGTTPVSTSKSYDNILFVELDSAATGNITIKDSSSNTIGTITATNSTINKSDSKGYYSDGLMYDLGVEINMGNLNYLIKRFPCYNESPFTSIERICDIGDSNGMWTSYYDFSNTRLNIYAISTAGTAYDRGNTPVRFKNNFPDANAIILKCAKIKDSDGTMSEIIGYGSISSDHTRIARAVDTSITVLADATQKAESIIDEISTMERIGDAEIPLEFGMKPRDTLKTFDIKSGSWANEKIISLFHKIDRGITALEIGDKIQNISTVEFLTDLSNVATYGMVGYQNLDDRTQEQVPIDKNLSSGYNSVISFNISESGIAKAYISIKGEKYRQASADSHYHDNAASYSVASHGHGYGTLEDTSQTHAFSNVSAFAYKAHKHDMGANDVISTETDSIASSGTHNHEDPYNPLAYGNHTHTTDGHDHALTGNTADNTSGTPQLYYCTVSNIGSSAAIMDSGSAGSYAPGISGNSGSRTVGPTMSEDTYPLGMTILIDGTDRTTALGGAWNDNFNLAGDNALDITDYVNTEGRHTVTFTSTRNGRIEGEILIYY